MVEHLLQLNNVFASLADPTRRDILKRVSRRSMSVGEIAEKYQLTFAAIAKHLSVLERAKLVSKTRRGKEQMVSLSPTGLAAASHYLDSYKTFWEQRLGNLDKLLSAKNRKTK